MRTDEDFPRAAISLAREGMATTSAWAVWLRYCARPARIVYGALHTDATGAGFDDQFIYEEIDKPRDQRRIPMQQYLRDEADAVFQAWKAIGSRTPY